MQEPSKPLTAAMKSQTHPRAKQIADKFCNGMFAGHSELYREQLAELLTEELDILIIELEDTVKGVKYQ